MTISTERLQEMLAENNEGGALTFMSRREFRELVTELLASRSGEGREAVVTDAQAVEALPRFTPAYNGLDEGFGTATMVESKTGEWINRAAAIRTLKDNTHGA